MVFLDANVLVYYLDDSSDSYKLTINQLQKLLNDDEQLVTSHHVIEEVLFVISKIDPKLDLTKIIKKIAELPSLILVEPSPSLDFALRYAELSKKLKAGVNDALILQLILDAGIAKVFTFDKKLRSQASLLGIDTITR